MTLGVLGSQDILLHFETPPGRVSLVFRSRRNVVIQVLVESWDIVITVELVSGHGR